MLRDCQNYIEDVILSDRRETMIMEMDAWFYTNTNCPDVAHYTLDL